MTSTSSGKCAAAVALFVWCGSLAFAATEPIETLDLASLPAEGLKELPQFAGKPDGAGVLKTWRLAVPAFQDGLFFSGDCRREHSSWPADANRILPWVVKGNFKDLFRKDYTQDVAVNSPDRHALFAVLRLVGGDFLAVLPVTGPKTMSWLEVNDAGDLLLRLGTLGTAAVACDAPVLAWARSPDVYAACRAAWEKTLQCAEVRGRTTWRSEKVYPEPFTYLGWCSWEQYHKDITEDVLVQAVDGIEASKLPIRWVLVDDGHQTATGRSLKSLAPDPKKFPHGWAPVLARRSPERIRWMGLWHAFIGLWGNIAPHNDLGPLNAQFMPWGEGKNAALIVKDNPAAAGAFFNALIDSARHYGFDYVKIDDQSMALSQYRGRANAVEAGADYSQALEAACQRQGRALINCMAHNAVCVFNTRFSAVTRCSIDYKLGDAARGKSHIRESYANTLWLGQTVWPDHDMFHSSDPNCGRLMAVSKALSGAPIYLSDAPKDFVRASITPLCFQDGRLLRPLAPAVPLPDSVCADAFNQPVAYRVIAPLANGCAAVAAYNLMEQAQPTTISASVSSNDYIHAPGLMQPYPGPWKQPAEGVVVYDWYAGQGARLDQPYAFKLEGFSDKLLLLCPVRHGWAVVGRTDKYLSPAAVGEVTTSPARLTVKLIESGPLVIWRGEGEPQAVGVKFLPLGNGFWKTDLPVKAEKQTLVIGLNN